ncbi:aldehyde dehydrogenase family protein, partial [Paraburkholderia sp. SIMBA_027]
MLDRLGVAKSAYTGGDMDAFSPVTGERTGQLKTVSPAKAVEAIDRAHVAFQKWRLVPAPKRGELVRLLGEELRAAKADLGRLVSI